MGTNLFLRISYRRTFLTAARGAFAVIGVLTVCLATAQPRVTWQVTGITEGDWNLTRGKAGWVNYLEANLNIGLWKGAQLEGAAIATYATGEPVHDDLLGYSNIYTSENKAFRLIQASLGQRFGRWGYLSIGLRNIDTDYFTSPATSFFTAPADADYPILSNNYPVATFPMSALGLQMELYPLPGLTLKASLYNGTAHDTPRHQFHFSPRDEGIFSIGCATYERPTRGEQPASYTLGYVTGRVPDEGIRPSLRWKTGFWGLVEQPFLHWRQTQWCLLLQGATMTRHREDTYGYWGVGCTVNNISRRRIMAGIAVNRMLDRPHGNELDTELTCLVPLLPWLSVQPALHFIRNDHQQNVVGLLRISVSWGNME